jgi:hypothetical protein
VREERRIELTTRDAYQARAIRNIEGTGAVKDSIPMQWTVVAPKIVKVTPSRGKLRLCAS